MKQKIQVYREKFINWLFADKDDALDFTEKVIDVFMESDKFSLELKDASEYIPFNLIKNIEELDKALLSEFELEYQELHDIGLYEVQFVSELKLPKAV